jgi:transcriptional regulator with XRE-family HTH domain
VRRQPSPAALRFRRAVAGRVRELAAKRKLSLVKMADFAGISRGHMGRIVAAQVSVTTDTLVYLAEALKVSVKDLLS